MVAQVLPLAFETPESAVADGVGTTSVATSLGDVRLTLHRDIPELREVWRDFERRAVCTHAQTYAWVEAWHRLVEAPAGSEAAVVVGQNDAGQILFIWPFEVVAANGLKTLEWIGQEQTNYNLGLYERDFALKVTAEDVRALLRAASRLDHGVSVASFLKQPEVWDGVPNPLAKLPHQSSPSAGYVVTLERDFEAVFNARFGKTTRHSLKRKERKLGSFGAVEYGWAASLGERLDILEAFFDQKSQWFAETGIHDAFASRHRAFYRAMAALDTPEDGQIQLGYMKVAGEVVATFIGVMRGDRFSLLLSSITGGELRRWSPGLLLLRSQIQDLCRRGVKFYDLGVGEARHKSEWADMDVPLFDSFIGFDPMGRLAVLPLSMRSRAKRIIKNEPHLWALAQKVRRLLRGRSGAQHGQPG